jgi:ABC-type sugar transport system ATPase subunit
MQMMEIAKAVSYNSELLIMDEPTSSLTETEIAQLFKIIRAFGPRVWRSSTSPTRWKRSFASATRSRFFGRQVRGGAGRGLPHHRELIRMMVGRELTSLFPKQDVPLGDVRLRVEDLSSPGAFENVTFDLRRGEILGFAGLVGAGRTELMETLFGLRPISSGRVLIDGRETRIRSPRDAKRAGLAFLTEDRRSTGIIGVGALRTTPSSPIWFPT